MRPTHIRAFEVEHTRFHVTDRGDGTLQVTSIHPYDETDYHWAMQASKSAWVIYRAGKKRGVFGSTNGCAVAPESIAEVLLDMDAKAGLKAKRAVW